MQSPTQSEVSVACLRYSTASLVMAGSKGSAFGVQATILRYVWRIHITLLSICLIGDLVEVVITRCEPCAYRNGEFLDKIMHMARLEQNSPRLLFSPKHCQRIRILEEYTIAAPPKTFPVLQYFPNHSTAHEWPPLHQELGKPKQAKGHHLLLSVALVRLI